jgi:amidohydrolase
MTLSKKVLEKSNSHENYIVEMRRHFHMNPELSCQEFKTRETISRELKELGIEVIHAGNASVIGILKGAGPGKTVALRADTDALPIQEANNVPYRSKTPGIMHACGHDAHSAMLLGAAKILSDMKSDINGEVRFFFQEGEEIFAGAKKIIEKGGLDGVDGILGMHIMANLPVGKFAIPSGVTMAGNDTIYVTVKGVSGHSSAPHRAKDAIHPACLMITDIQTILAKNIDPLHPAILVVGKFEGGTKANIIANTAKFDISMRYFNPQSRKHIHDAIGNHIASISRAYGVEFEIEIAPGPPSLINNDHIASIARESVGKLMGIDAFAEIETLCGSEDMAYYVDNVPGAMAFLGTLNPSKGIDKFHHHDEFDIDEDVLKHGTALYSAFALNFLNKRIDNETDVQ